MYRFFVNANQWNEGKCPYVEGDDYNHIHNVLRMKTGEEILICDEGDKEYQCRITGYDEQARRVDLEIVDIFGNARELPARIVLFQGYPKGDKLETIIQKAVELGVSEVVPVSMKRSVVKLDEKKATKKVERMNAIALAAAKQSKRGRIPEVTNVMSLREACEYARDLEYVLLPYENADGMTGSKKCIHDAKGKKSIGIFIGPEGGFDDNEVALIESVGGNTISLGHRILRTETAALTIMSLLMFELEED